MWYIHLFWDSGSCSPGLLSICYIAEIGLELVFPFFYLLNTEITHVSHHAYFYVMLGSTEPKALCKIGKHSANYATSLVSWILIMQSLNRTYTYCISVGYISEHSVALSFQSLCYRRHTMNDKHNTLWKMLKVNVRKANRKSRTELGWEDEVQLHC